MRSLAYRLFCVRQGRGLRHRCRGLCVALHWEGLGGGGGGLCGEGGFCRDPLSSHPHSLFSSVCRSGSSSDNHYYRVPHHGHSRADNNSCLKKLVRSLLLCLVWGVAWDGDRVGMEVPIQLQVPKPVAPARIDLERHCRRKWGVYTKTSKGEWLIRVRLCPRSFPTSHHLARGFGDQHMPRVGWTGLTWDTCTLPLRG